MKSVYQLVILVCFFLFTLESINAQVQIDGTDGILNKLRLNKGLEGDAGTLYKDIQGNPYIFPDFHQGIMHIIPNQKINVEIRYDIFADQMHLKDKDQIYAIVRPEKVQLIEAGSYKFIYCAYLKSPGDKDPAESSYFIISKEGKCVLLLKKNLRVQDAEPPKLYQEAKPAKFIPTDDTYFLKMDGMSAVKIKNKKELLSVMADKSDEIDKYITANKLDTKELKDLEKIVVYYNGL